MRNMKKNTLIMIAIAALVTTSSFAADHSNLEEGLPTELTDSKPIGYLGRELQFYTRYERGHDGVDSLRLVPRIEIGWPRDFQLSVEAPSIFGEIEPDGFGDVTFEGFWNINQETLVIPAFALAGTVQAPTGQESYGVDPAIKFVFTKTISPKNTIGRNYVLHQIHGNALWQFNDNQKAGERNGRYKAVLGYSTAINNVTLFIIDYVREQEMENDVNINLVEFGIRRQITPFAVLSLGAGFGIAQQSPDVRTTLGLQMSF